MLRRAKSGLVLIALAAAGSSTAGAAPIVWSTLGTVSGPSDVKNLGAVVEAQYAASGSAQTVNGVTFAAGFTNYAAPGGVFTGALNGVTTGNTAYDTILNSIAYDGANPGVLTLTGLTSGQAYQVELWQLDNRTDSAESSRTADYTDGGSPASSSATFSEGSDTIILGNFVASSGTQTIDVTGVGQSQHNLNAFAVTTATPEPGAAAALLGVAGLAALRRFRRTRIAAPVR